MVQEWIEVFMVRFRESSLTPEVLFGRYGVGLLGWKVGSASQVLE